MSLAPTLTTTTVMRVRDELIQEQFRRIHSEEEEDATLSSHENHITITCNIKDGDLMIYHSTLYDLKIHVVKY